MLFNLIFIYFFCNSLQNEHLWLWIMILCLPHNISFLFYFISFSHFEEYNVNHNKCNCILCIFIISPVTLHLAGMRWMQYKEKKKQCEHSKKSSKSQSSPLFATEAATGCSSTSIRTVTDWAFVLHSLVNGGGRQHGKGKRSKKRHFRLEISFLFINMGNVHGCFD